MTHSPARTWARLILASSCVILATIVALAREPNLSPAPPRDARLTPYSPDAAHLWNQLHNALFTREAADGSRHTHTTDPLLYTGGTFLLTDDSHRRAIESLDQFLAQHGEKLIENPPQRLFLQHDLWAAFDYAAWVADNWVYQSRNEPAAIALRGRLAKAIARLALDDRQISALPDNYALAVQSKQFPTAHDPAHPERPFLPDDLFDPKGSWVRFHEIASEPMAEQHFAGAGGRAVHIIFIRLPEGRAATEQYLKDIRPNPLKQFPEGTMVALVRRTLTVDSANKVHLTPITESVQIRVYRHIPEGNGENAAARDPHNQDAYEFVLDRAKLFAGGHGLRAVTADEPFTPFERGSPDPFNPASPKVPVRASTQLASCIGCHSAPGVLSVQSMARGLRRQLVNITPFQTYEWDAELGYTVHAKTDQFNWGLLQGQLEANKPSQ